MQQPVPTPTTPPAAKAPTRLKGIILAFFIFVVLPFGGLAIIWKDACRTYTVQELTSPGGVWLAAVRRTECRGGEIKPATELAVASKPQGATEPEWHTAILYQGSTDPRLSWDESATSLSIAYPKDAAVVKQRGQGGGLKLSYETF